MRDLDSGSGSLKYAVLIPPCQAMTPGLHGQGNAPTQTRLRGQEIVVVPCLLTFGSNRMYTVGRVVQVEDLMKWRFAPRGFDFLRISMQNSSKGSDDMTSEAEHKRNQTQAQWSFAAEAWREVTYRILLPTCLRS